MSDPVNPETIEQTKQQIRGLVSEIAQLSKTDLSPEQYYAAFLQRIVSALAAVGGAVWILDDNRRPELAYQINISDTLLVPESEDSERHRRLLEYVIASNEPQLNPPNSGPGDERMGGKPTNYLLVLCPLRSEDRVEGVIEVFQRSDSQPVTQRGYLRFLIQMCEMAGEWLKTQKLKDYSDRHSLWAEADHFSRLVHDSLDLRETCFAVVNEGRRLIGCDRVSVAVKKGNRCKIEAVSGQDTIENRSNVVSLLSDVATKVVATGEPLWNEGITDDLPPQLERSLEEYIDESYAKSLCVLPLRKPRGMDETPEATAHDEASMEDNTQREVIGALIIEQIESEFTPENLKPRIDLVYEHSARALSNAVRHNYVFMMPVLKRITAMKWLVQARTLPKTLFATVAILTAIIAMCVVPADFGLEADGKLQPIDRREVFAGLEGIIRQVHVEHGQEVEVGTPLATMENPDLHTQMLGVAGELAENEKQLLSITRTLIEQAATLTPDEKIRLNGQKAQLLQRQTTLTAQRDVIKAKEDQLVIRSPIKGQVVTWDVDQTLLHRPVMTGQALMTIANPAGGWEIEMFMKETRMGHVTAAYRDPNRTEPLPVVYILKSDPGHEREGEVQAIHDTTDMDGDGVHSVKIRVKIDQDSLPSNPRPGTSVIGDVIVGREPIGYTWFHEAIEWVQANVLF